MEALRKLVCPTLDHPKKTPSINWKLDHQIRASRVILNCSSQTTCLTSLSLLGDNHSQSFKNYSSELPLCGRNEKFWRFFWLLNLICWRPCYNYVSISIESIKGYGSVTNGYAIRSPSTSNNQSLYMKQMSFFQPNLVIDHQNGNLWEIELRLGKFH